MCRGLLFLFCIVIFLQGCVTKSKRTETHAEFDRQAQTAIGKDINIVISRLGVPTSTYVMPNGNQIYSYEKSMDLTTPVVSSSNLIGDQITTTGGEKIRHYCKLNYIIDKNTQKVVATQSEGNACLK